MLFKFYILLVYVELSGGNTSIFPRNKNLLNLSGETLTSAPCEEHMSCELAEVFHIDLKLKNKCIFIHKKILIRAQLHNKLTLKSINSKIKIKL